MMSLLFVLILQFPPGCPCLQVAAGSDLTPFDHVAVELLATVESQVPNEGVYYPRGTLFWPNGIAVVLLDREPPVSDPLAGYRYGVVPIGGKRLIFADGLESGDLGAWKVVR